MFKIIFVSIFIGFVFAQNNSFSPDPTQRALQEAGIRKSTSLQAKINLLLFLLNDRRYLSESSPDPQFSDNAKFQTTPFAEATRLIEKYRENSSDGNNYNPYALGTMRTPAEMLTQRIGGQCEAAARTLASLLIASGVSSSDIRIVEGVTKQDYEALCPSRGQKIEAKNLGLSGHAFVLIKIGGGWKLINPTYAPIGNYESHEGPNREALAGFRRPPIGDGKTWNLRMLALIEKLSPSDLDMVDFKIPSDIEKELKGHRLPSLPQFSGLPELKPGPPGKEPINFRDMGIFLITAPDKFPSHSFTQRANLIASGTLESSLCRFDPPSGQTGNGSQQSTRSAP